MNKFIYLMFFVTLQASNVGSVSATDSMADVLPVLERQVIKISAQLDDAVAITIPRAAVTNRNGVTGVFVLENKLARFRMVRLGKIGISQIEILSGLFGNETLIIAKLDVMHDGSPIAVLNKNSVIKK